MPAIPAPTIQTSAWIFWSSEGAADLFAVADQIETPSREPGGCFDTGFWALRRWLRTLVTIPNLRSIRGVFALFGFLKVHSVALCSRLYPILCCSTFPFRNDLHLVEARNRVAYVRGVLQQLLALPGKD